MNDTYLAAVEFFSEHAGLAIRPDESEDAARLRVGKALARAEADAKARGWYVSWEIDTEADVTPGPDYFVSGNPQWCAALYDENDLIVADLCGIDFAEAYDVTPESDPYARVVSAQLAGEALTSAPAPAPGETYTWSDNSAMWQVGNGTRGTAMTDSALSYLSCRLGQSDESEGRGAANDYANGKD